MTRTSKSRILVGCAAALLMMWSGSASDATVEANERPTLDEVSLQLAEEFARQEGISVADSVAAMEESGFIAEFNRRMRPDRRFGAVWVTYEGGYQVHVRAVNDPATLADEIAELEEQIGRRIVRHSGGAAAADVWSLVDRVLSEALSVHLGTNESTGYLTIYAGTDRSQIPPEFPVEFLNFVDDPVSSGGELDGGFAGSDYKMWNGSAFAPVCTAGFTYGGFGATGFVTAGHCPDAAPATPATLDNPWDSVSTPLEVCASSGIADFQVVRFLNNSDPSELMMLKNPSVYYWAYDVAGGFFEGQQTLKIGLWSNATRTNIGVAQKMETRSSAGSGDCGAGTYLAFNYSNARMSGDSGGPVTLAWGGQWYIAGTHSGTNGSQPYGNWHSVMNPSSYAPSGHWCTYVNPCGVRD